MLALAEPGAMLPAATGDRLVAFGAAAVVAMLAGLLCSAAYRQVTQRR